MTMLKNNRANSTEWAIENGWLTDVEIQPSSHFEPRDKNESISLLVVHNMQYVSFNDKAWHAGVSRYQERDKCNDFSIGIELEGTDDIPYTKEQYQQLSQLSRALIAAYPALQNNIVGHCDIAPGRKTDPGISFDWQCYRALLAENG